MKKTQLKFEDKSIGLISIKIWIMISEFKSVSRRYINIDNYFEILSYNTYLVGVCHLFGITVCNNFYE